MKRAALSLLLVLASLPLFAIDTTTKPTERIGVLRLRERYTQDGDSYIATHVLNALRHELKRRGFDAFDAGGTYEDLSRGEADTADYYVEIASSDVDASESGGIGIGGRNVGVEISVVHSSVAAELRIYDGRSLELVDSFDLRRNRTTVMPTAIGVGDHNFWGWLAVPVVQYAQFRSTARAVAREAATRIAEMPRQ